MLIEAHYTKKKINQNGKTAQATLKEDDVQRERIKEAVQKASSMEMSRKSWRERCAAP